MEQWEMKNDSEKLRYFPSNSISNKSDIDLPKIELGNTIRMTASSVSSPFSVQIFPHFVHYLIVRVSNKDHFIFCHTQSFFQRLCHKSNDDHTHILHRAKQQRTSGARPRSPTDNDELCSELRGSHWFAQCRIQKKILESRRS